MALYKSVYYYYYHYLIAVSGVDVQGGLGVYRPLSEKHAIFNQSINQSILFAQNVQRYTYKAIQLRAGQQG